jgi:hypothetical protein
MPFSTPQTFRSSLVTSDIAVCTLPSIDRSKINQLYTSNIVLAMVRSVLDGKRGVCVCTSICLSFFQSWTMQALACYIHVPS